MGGISFELNSGRGKQDKYLQPAFIHPSSRASILPQRFTPKSHRSTTMATAIRDLEVRLKKLDPNTISPSGNRRSTPAAMPPEGLSLGLVFETPEPSPFSSLPKPQTTSSPSAVGLARQFTPHRLDRRSLERRSRIHRIWSSIDASETAESLSLHSLSLSKSPKHRSSPRKLLTSPRTPYAGLTSRVTLGTDLRGLPVVIDKPPDLGPSEGRNIDRDDPVSTKLVTGKGHANAITSFYCNTPQTYNLPVDVTYGIGENSSAIEMIRNLRSLRTSLSNMTSASFPITIYLHIRVTPPGPANQPGLAFQAILRRPVEMVDLWDTIKDINKDFLFHSDLAEQKPQQWRFELRPTLYESRRHPLVWHLPNTNDGDAGSASEAMWKDVMDKCTKQGRQTARMLLHESKSKCSAAIVKLRRAPYNADGRPRDEPSVYVPGEATVHGNLWLGF